MPRGALLRPNGRPALALERCGLTLFGVQLIASLVSAQCTSFTSTPPAARLGDTIELRFGADVPTAVVADAVALWRGCAEYGSGFPAFVTAPAGTRALEIRVHDSPGPDRCGSFHGSRIDLYPSTEDRRGKQRLCGPLAINLAHELGHALGLADAAHETSCRDHIMSRIVRTNLHARRVRAEECRAAADRWLTRVEQERFARLGRLAG